MTRPGGWTGNLVLLIASVGVGFAALELACRMLPLCSATLQVNDPYRYIETMGERSDFRPLHTYREQVPLRFDHHGYYAASRGTIAFHSNQLGARWVEPTAQPLDSTTVLVLGDSFTYGHGLRYDDTFVYRLQQGLASAGSRVSFVNFAIRGADTVEVLGVYRRFAPKLRHAAVLYGLHVNDLIDFPTSFAVTNPLALPWAVERSRGYAFVVGRLHDFTLRRYRLAHLTAAERLEDRHFQREMAALTILSSDVRRSGARFQVVLLPLLVELRQRTLAPLYDGIKKALAARGIECLDLSGSLGGFEDSDVWVLPFDQHPNHVANEVFAEALIGELRRSLLPRGEAPRSMWEPGMGPSLGP